jgi:hypothetical protein
MKDYVRLGVDYEKAFENDVLPSLNANWKRTGSVVGKTNVCYVHPVYRDKYAVPDYHLLGTNRWLEIKTVSQANADNGKVSFSKNEMLHFAKMQAQGQEIFILRHVQGDDPTNFKIYKLDVSAIELPKKISECVLMSCRESIELN